MYESFTDSQIKELAVSIVDMYGSDLPLDEVNESIYIVLEDIPGIELLSSRKIQSLITQIRSQYYD